MVAAGHDVALVVSRPDRRRARGAPPTPSPVKAAARAAGLPVAEDVEAVVATGAELGVVVAFGQIIRPPVLAAVPMVNLHFSLLPRWRGAAPVERAVLAGDAETGVCLMTLEAGLDTGPVHRCVRVAIGAEETAAELRARLVDLGTGLLVEELAAGLTPPVPQVGQPTYAAKIEPADLRLDWSRPADELERVVRVGGAWTTVGGRRLKVHRACAHRITGRGVTVPTGSGPLELLDVQAEGRPAMAATAWARGAAFRPGDRLGT